MTAEEFAEKIQYEIEEHDEGGYLGINTKLLAEKLIEFAKYHVQKSSEELRQGLIEDGYMNEDDKLIDLTGNIK